MHAKRNDCSGVREVAEAGFAWEEHVVFPIGFTKDGLAQVYLAKVDFVHFLHLLLLFLIVTHLVLLLRHDLDGALVVDDFLHVAADKLVERVELLPHKTTLVKVGTDNGPCILLINLCMLKADLLLSRQLILHSVGVHGCLGAK